MSTPARERFFSQAASLLARLRACASAEASRRVVFDFASDAQYEAAGLAASDFEALTRARDCARALRTMCTENAEQRAGFAVATTLWELAHGQVRADLSEGFFTGLGAVIEGLATVPSETAASLSPGERASGREAAVSRSSGLDALWAQAEQWMARYPDGLEPDVITTRAQRRARLLAFFGGSEDDWSRAEWQLAHLVRTPEVLEALVGLGDDERDAVRLACRTGVPFAITPYYLSLFDDEPSARDRAVRAQVLPPQELATALAQRHERRDELDFMRERDTSPVDLVTRRYPAIAIFKPFNTCPQICTYCQRNWEIDEAMAPCALASATQIDEALRWIGSQTAIRELLVTGGDPLGLDDARLGALLDRVCALPHLDLVRIGTRTPVTLPMRISDALVQRLAALRAPGRRELALVTHVQSVYEISPEFVAAVERLRRAGISVYNQHVLTFHGSRRFENAKLRLMLRRCGVDPYYTFMPKGKQETAAYRVPLARLAQERKEEARLLPGLRRTDASVYNVPALGKNPIEAQQHRDLLAILPDGRRVYLFHPWEKGIAPCEPYVDTDPSIADYLERLESIGERAQDYASIWYFF